MNALGLGQDIGLSGDWSGPSGDFIHVKACWKTPMQVYNKSKMLYKRSKAFLIQCSGNESFALTDSPGVKRMDVVGMKGNH